MHYSLLLSAILIFKDGVNAEVSAKHYAIMPELFHQDNYDNCMMLEDEAFYCSLTYELEPINKENPPDIWTIIKNVSDIRTNYRHDHLRRWICVPTTCPGINITQENDPLLKQALEHCYNKKYEDIGLKGTISQIQCETHNPRYPIDWLDVLAAILFLSYTSFVMYATYFEGIARYKPPEEYTKIMSTRMGKIFSACSITRNWIRLKTVNRTAEIQKLRCIQGIRVYNMGLVVLSHTVMAFVAPPVENTRYPETMQEKNATLFFSSGPLCVATFFLISSFLLTNGLFEFMKEKRMTIKMVFVVFLNRIFRLTPTIFAIILFHATFLRHLGSGPNWEHFVITEYKKCRKNGWSNLLYINNWWDPTNMCLPITWYMALDTQYFILSVLFIWFLKKFENHVWYILSTAISITAVATFSVNYYHDFSALIFPTAEMFYGLHKLFKSKQFQHQTCGFVGNIAGSIVGIAFGYYFFKHKNDETPLFNTKFRKALWWILTFGLGLGYVIIPGLIILRDSAEHDAFWASIYVGLSRPLFTFAIGLGILGFSEGVGWLALRTLQWTPTYVLGRLSFSAYICHMSVVLIRASLARYPLHLSDFEIFLGFCGDLAVVYIFATIVTLFIELPVSQLQKYIFVDKNGKEETNIKEQKDQ